MAKFILKTDSNFSKNCHNKFLKYFRTELIHAVLTLLLENTVIILFEDFFLHVQFLVQYCNSFD